MTKQTDKIKNRYNRISNVYNMMDHMIRPVWRKEMLRNVEGNILEVGVGTGANFDYYPINTHVTGIDFSPQMLEKAKEKLPSSKAHITLKEMDIENLGFSDNTFDVVISSCVFCSVPNPVAGFKEIRRVVKHEGKIIMLEHMRSDNPLIGSVLDIINPFAVRLSGANVNRNTVSNIEKAGLKIESEEYLLTSIMRKLVILPNK